MSLMVDPRDSAAVEAWFAAIRTRLAQPLPGIRSQHELAHELGFGRHSGPAPYDARSAAVLVLLFPRESNWQVPLILRPSRMKKHAGQVAFPGGMHEPNESLWECALREAREELGIDATTVECLGELSPLYIFASNFRVSAFVAASRVAPRFQPDPAEVAEVLELSLSALWDVDRRGRHLVERQGVQFEVPHLECSGQRIWGATRVLLGELSFILEDVARSLAARPLI